MMERYEEMNRMREHVFKEVDKDKDSMISFNEFIQSTQGKDFEKDEGWDVSVTVFLYVSGSGKFSYLYFTAKDAVQNHYEIEQTVARKLK